MPSTPGEDAEADLESTLPAKSRGKTLGDLNVAEEAESIKTIAAEAGAHCLPLSSPNSIDVLVTLPYHNIAHFACHGVVSHTDPLQTCLVFQRPTDTAETKFVRDELKVLDILKFRRQIKNAYNHHLSLVYLSACSSASNHSIDMSEEPLHIAGVFQLAGYNNAIGTLWDSEDEVCIDIAKRFYNYLFKFERRNRKGKGRATDNGWGCAEALHLAVEEVRSQYWQAPSWWAPFVHWGT
ncbi:CHAT domain-containing protein [Kalaharituber pfeilii]|nr:CHAT domain-containing protein [Kalaharituber pfeilii]